MINPHADGTAPQTPDFGAAERLAVTEAWMRGKELVNAEDYGVMLNHPDQIALNGSHVANDIAALRAENERLTGRLRLVCQTLVAEVGADGPCDAEDAARRVVADLAALRDQYHDLLYQVGEVTPGETRHESARRIIRQHEDHCGQGGPVAARASQQGDAP